MVVCIPVQVCLFALHSGLFGVVFGGGSCRKILCFPLGSCPIWMQNRVKPQALYSVLKEQCISLM